MLRNQLAIFTVSSGSSCFKQRNRAFWENGALLVLLSLCLVAEGKSDAEFFI